MAREGARETRGGEAAKGRESTAEAHRGARSRPCTRRRRAWRAARAAASRPLPGSSAPPPESPEEKAGARWPKQAGPSAKPIRTGQAVHGPFCWRQLPAGEASAVTGAPGTRAAAAPRRALSRCELRRRASSSSSPIASSSSSSSPSSSPAFSAGLSSGESGLAATDPPLAPPAAPSPPCIDRICSRSCAICLAWRPTEGVRQVRPAAAPP